MTAPARIDVVIPARDEEALIGGCLGSVARAVAAVHDHPRFSGVDVAVTVVADGCSDSTVSIARSFPGVTVESVDFACVGAARAHGVASVLDRATPPARVRWVANTDADSTVPTNWLTLQLDLAASGVDLVIGTVRPASGDLSEEQWRVWRDTHVAGQPNGHVHGANLGFRLDSYLDCGGYRPIPEHEDNDLVARLKAAGVRSAASDSAEVVTSGRRIGRTLGGYAGFLRLLDESAAHAEFDLGVDIEH